jgi:hypothetical protein
MVASKTTVLVFPCGSEIGLEIWRSLHHSTHLTLVGASSVASNHGKYLYQRYVEGLPMVDAPGFIPALNEVIDAHGARFLYAAHDSVVLKFAEEADHLHAEPIGPPAATAAICRSKRATYAAFAGKLRVPAVLDPDAAVLPLPVFLKPDVGQGSKGTHRAETREEVAFHRARDPSLMVLEYLPGEEYTVDCFTDRHGALRFAGGRERIRTASGISVDTRPVATEAFQQLAEVINRTLRLRGVWFFQLKRAADGALALLEIGPRVAGAMGLHRNLGLNLPLTAFFDRLDQEVELRRTPVDLRMDRALEAHFAFDHPYRHVYLDLDDTLIQDGKVNLPAIAFVYQCRNRGVAVHLLSRHAADLGATLSRHGLAGLFRTTTHVAEGMTKSGYITERDAIFIDDSFRERREVMDSVGIPTFAPDAIECLLDWRR